MEDEDFAIHSDSPIKLVHPPQAHITSHTQPFCPPALLDELARAAQLTTSVPISLSVVGSSSPTFSSQGPTIFSQCLHHFVPLQKKAILEWLQNPLYIKLGGDKVINEAGKELQEQLEGTMEHREGNSCLILGPQGSGKSLVSHHCLLVHCPLIHFSMKLVKTTLRGFMKKAIIIQLSGHAQATGQCAMCEISYQLNHQTGCSFTPPEDNVEDMTPRGEEDNIQYNFAPPVAYLPMLILQLPTLSCPVIVVLDAFDLFTQQP
jgi:origin recognition complex subunit 4